MKAASRLQETESFIRDSRKLYRLFKFIDMWSIYQHLEEKRPAIRRLRELRIFSFCFFFLTENLILVATKLQLIHSRPLGIMRRSCYSSWCLSIFLGIVLDYLMQRGTVGGYIKAAIDFPISVIFSCRLRVNDGLLGAMGVASSLMGLSLRNQLAQ